MIKLTAINFIVTIYLKFRFTDSVRQLKIIILLLLCCGFSTPNAALFRSKSIGSTEVNEKTHFSGKKDQNLAKDQITLFKRKVKTKGLLVIVPHIPKIYSLQDYVYNEYFFQKESKDYYCSLHYVQCKRGPPSGTL